MKNKNSSIRKNILKWKYPLVAAVIVALAVGLYAIFGHHNKGISLIPSTVPSNSTGTNQQNQNPPSTRSPSSSPTTGSSQPTKSAQTIGNSQTLVAPTGTFVSNHHPSLSGSTNPSGEQSVCITSVGASCFIEFTNTKTGVVKQLKDEAVDNNGTAYWNWDVKTAGLSQGEWRITAVATLNGDTKSTSDQLLLEVQP